MSQPEEILKWQYVRMPLSVKKTKRGKSMPRGFRSLLEHCSKPCLHQNSFFIYVWRAHDNWNPHIKNHAQCHVPLHWLKPLGWPHCTRSTYRERATECIFTALGGEIFPTRAAAVQINVRNKEISAQGWHRDSVKRTALSVPLSAPVQSLDSCNRCAKSDHLQAWP